VKKETRNALMAAGIVAAVFAASYVCLIVYSGESPPFYTVESGSMMHSDSSKIGIIDTGDLVIVRDPSKVSITTYIEGHETGYQKFGDYGDVIIYNAPGGKTIIHRAILYLELNTDGTTWNVRGYDSYTGTKFCTDDTSGAMSGTLTLSGLGYDGTRTISLNLNSLTSAGSGFITMGDHNTAHDGLVVNYDMVTAVAAHEIPWLGCIKMYLTGNNTDRIPSNSLWSLVIVIIVIAVSATLISISYDRLKHRKD